MSTYTYDVFEKAGVRPNGNAIFYGISHNLLPASSVASFGEWLITNQEDTEGLYFFEGNDCEAIQVLRKAGYNNEEFGKKYLRYAVLLSLDLDDKELLEKIELVYANFDYPSDMEDFIYYMPQSSKETFLSEKTLINRFSCFMKEEKQILGL